MSMKVELKGYNVPAEPVKAIDQLLSKNKRPTNTAVGGTYSIAMGKGLIKEEKATPDFYQRCKKLAKDGVISTETISKAIILEFKRLYLDSIKGDGQDINIEWFKYADEILFNVMQPVIKYLIDRSILFDDTEKAVSIETMEDMKALITRSFNNANMLIEFDSNYSYDYSNFYNSLEKFFDTFN